MTFIEGPPNEAEFSEIALQWLAQPQADAEPGFAGPAAQEPAADEKALGMRVADDVQHCGAAFARNFGAMLHQASPNPQAPALRLDEEAVELRVAVAARQDHREPDDQSVLLCYEHSLRLDLTLGPLDRVGIGQYCRPVARIAE